MRRFTKNFVARTLDFVARTLDFVARTLDFVARTLDFVARTLDFVARTLDFVARTLDFVARTLDFVARTLDFVARTLDFVARTLDFVARKLDFVARTLDFIRKGRAKSMYVFAHESAQNLFVSTLLTKGGCTQHLYLYIFCFQAFCYGNFHSFGYFIWRCTVYLVGQTSGFLRKLRFCTFYPQNVCALDRYLANEIGCFNSNINYKTP